MKTFIIHMDGDEKRAPNVQSLRAQLPNATVLPAVLGKSHLSTYDLHSGTLHHPPYPFPLGAGELGCFLSHRACWKRIVDSGDDYALIVEDDAHFDPARLPRLLDLIHQTATADSYIRLPAKTRETTAGQLHQAGDMCLFLPRVIGLQTVAQIVGRTAAARLLSATQQIDRPVDTFLQMHWITKQPVQTILPNGVSELTTQLGGSTIQKRPSGNKLLRELRRSLYRYRVSRHPQTPPAK